MERQSWRQLDFPLFLVAVLLLAYGIAMVYSATLQLQSPSVDERVYRQLAYAGVGLFLMVLIILVDYRLLGSGAWLLYAVGLGLLAMVLAIGQVTHGAQRWISLGLFDLQPSEPAKLLIILALAKYLADREEEIRHFRYLLVSLVIVLPAVVLTFAQPNLATSAVFLMIWAGMVVVAGARLLHCAALAAIGLAASPLVWSLLQPYQRERIELLLGLKSDPQGSGFGVQQALIGIGAGGLFGRGFTSGTQSQLHFLQVQYSDFIFSVVAEELGFLGALALLVLFVVLIFRSIRVASLARDGFGRLIATGIAVMLTFQAFVNVGMNIGLLPVAGITLPLISYGGSSLVALLIAIGLLQSIILRHKRPSL